jgi:hypothetical protein
MKNLDQILEDYANKAGGRAVQYTDEMSFILLPTVTGELQKVVGFQEEVDGQLYYRFEAQICPFSQDVNLMMLLDEAYSHFFGKIIVRDGHFQIAARTISTRTDANIVIAMVKEVAEIASKLRGTIQAEIMA